MNTVEFFVHGTEQATRMAALLVEESQYFAVTPLPADEYEFSVKAENRPYILVWRAQAVTYNGWTNRETWLVNLWFNPETKSDVCMAKVCLEDAVEACPDYLQDFINLSAINWDELVKHVEE